jgi:hypothetical protein
MRIRRMERRTSYLWTCTFLLSLRYSAAEQTKRQQSLFRGIQVDTRPLVFGERQLNVRFQNMPACLDRSPTGPAHCPALHRYL